MWAELQVSGLNTRFSNRSSLAATLPFTRVKNSLMSFWTKLGDCDGMDLGNLLSEALNPVERVLDSVDLVIQSYRDYRGKNV